MNAVLNFVGYQLVWFAAVWGAAHGMWWLGPLAGLPFIVWQVCISERPRIDLKLVGLALVCGFLVDSALAWSGLIRYASAVPSAQMAPFWILAMWACFAMTLNHSLAWLRRRPLLTAAFSALGAPLSYAAAARGWQAVTFMQPHWHTYIVIALAWGIAMPALMRAAVFLHEARNESLRDLRQWVH